MNMESIFKSEMTEVLVNRELGIAEFNSLSVTTEIKVEYFKSNTLKSVEIFEQLLNSGINRFLYDTRDQSFPITPDLQEWTSNLYIPFIDMEYKLAVLLSLDLVAALSIEQTTEEFAKNKATKNESQFFVDKESAIKWLLS